MSTALAQLNTNMTMWEDSTKLNEIRKLFAPKLTEMEFQFFVGLGKATNLNPFTREIWCVKYQESAPAQVFIGRDGYRKAAQAHSEYDFHQSDAVYENDDFEVTNGEVSHKYKLTNRGNLVGAYCIAKRHKSSRPMYVFADLREYSTGKSLWNPQSGKPATMIKKVAESQCLRACFQDLLGGTYGEEEMEQQTLRTIDVSSIQGATQVERLKSVLKERNNHVEGHTASTVPGESYSSECNNVQSLQDDERADGSEESPASNGDLRISSSQLVRIKELFYEKGFNQERVDKALAYYKVDEVASLDGKTAQNFILQLERA